MPSFFNYKIEPTASKVVLPPDPGHDGARHRPEKECTMDHFTAIARRHSYRGPFREEPLVPEDLRRIVQAGLQAPSGRNEQTTTFVVVDDFALLAEIWGLHGANQAMQTARACIAAVNDADPPAVYEGYHFQVEDCAAAVENMLLAVTALGYATVWIDGWLRVQGRAARVGKLLGLPPGKVVRILLPLGRPVEEHQQKEKKPFAERAWFNRYGG